MHAFHARLTECAQVAPQADQNKVQGLEFSFDTRDRQPGKAAQGYGNCGTHLIGSGGFVALEDSRRVIPIPGSTDCVGIYTIHGRLPSDIQNFAALNGVTANVEGNAGCPVVPGKS